MGSREGNTVIIKLRLSITSHSYKFNLLSFLILATTEDFCRPYIRSNLLLPQTAYILKLFEES